MSWFTQQPGDGEEMEGLLVYLGLVKAKRM